MIPTVNSILNLIHEWDQPEQSISTRWGLSRLGNVALIAIESTAVAYAALQYGRLLGRGIFKVTAIVLVKAFPKAELLLPYTKQPPNLQDINNELLDLCHQIVGLASTLFIGFFNPTYNFNLHIKFGLATDNLLIKKEKKEAAKQEAAFQTAEINKARAERFAKFQADRQAQKDAEIQRKTIDPRLADLLLKTSFLSS